MAACVDWAAVCARVDDYLEGQPSDPFQISTVVVPGAAHRRALSQHLATRSARTDRQICAGIEMPEFSGLRRRIESQVLGFNSDDDPWRPPTLTMHIAQLVRSHADRIDHGTTDDWFAPIAHYLRPIGSDLGQRPGRLLGFADDFAQLILGYEAHRPELLLSWDRGGDVDALGSPLSADDQWQPFLWRELTARLPLPHSAARLEALERALANDKETFGAALPRNIAVITLEGFNARDTAFIRVLAEHIPVAIWQLGAPPSDQDGSALRKRYGRARDKAWRRLTALGPVTTQIADETCARPRTSALTRLQDELRSAAAPGSAIRDHISSGNDGPEAVTTKQVDADIDPHEVPPGSGSDQRELDKSVQIHLSHGPDRQVEVLRELLCGLFDEDPTLQPRDVVVMCTDVPQFAPLLQADFQATAATGLHPGHSLRAKVAGPALERPNQVLALVVALFGLPESRATSQDLVDICSLGPVAARFGFDDDALATLPQLLSSAEVRWGIDSNHRRAHGLAGIRQSTWVSGIDRMLAGLVMSDNPSSRLDTVVPIAHLESTDASLIGGLAEFVSRVRMHLGIFATPATMPQWRDRILAVISDLTEVGIDEQWQVNNIAQELDRLDAHSWRGTEAAATSREDQLGASNEDEGAGMEIPGSPAQNESVLLNASDVSAMVRRLLRRGRGRADFGTGSLVICGLGDMQALPHRVVVLLGVDDAHFPPRVAHNHDDLLSRRTVVSTRIDTDARARQQFLDAILCAQDKLLVIGRGIDELTGERLPTPVVISDLIAATSPTTDSTALPTPAVPGALVSAHTLQPYDAENFRFAGQPPVSFDHQALKGARALAAPSSGALPRWWQTHRKADDEQPAQTRLDVDQLIEFYRDPAAAWFTATFGFRPRDQDSPMETELPLASSPLVAYTTGTQMLNALLAGESSQSIEANQLLSGSLPPDRLGREELMELWPQVQAIADQVSLVREQGGTSVSQPIEVRLLGSGASLSGQAQLFGDRLLVYRFARLKAKDLLGAWIQLLASVASGLPVRSCELLMRGNQTSLAAPSRDEAMRLLTELVAVRHRGLRDFLPLPLEAALRFVQAQRRGGAGSDRAASFAFNRDVAYSALWKDHLMIDWPTLLAIPAESEDPLNTSHSRFKNLAKWLFDPIEAARDNSGMRPAADAWGSSTTQYGPGSPAGSSTGRRP